MHNILITGIMGTGKTTVADYLVHTYGYRKYSLSDWLKNTLDNHYKLKELGKNDIIKINNKFYTKRKLYQEFGTEYIRAFDKDWHIDETIKSIDNHNMFVKCQPFVIDDVRFENESVKFKNIYKELIVIKVNCEDNKRLKRLEKRDGNIDKSSFNHSSESEVDFIICDYIIDNNSTIYKLKEKIDDIIKELK
jgi:dephospho-CoA kinase